MDVSNSKCHEYIEKNYMFYLSFENSICEDYVTEKFWKFLNGNLVPVVLGGANYDKIAPPHSFINAMDFSSPNDLAEYLKYLISNSTAYNEYFKFENLSKTIDREPIFVQISIPIFIRLFST